MTQEENYKQKYKDALERASKLRVQNPFDTVGQMVEHIFPELKESEDERIKKGLIKTVSSLLDNTILYHTDITKEEALAWLKKQGKEEYALKSFKDEDIRKFMQYIEKQAKAYDFNLPNRGYDIYAFAKDILHWLEKQGEKKPTLPKWKYKKDHIPLLKDSLILNKYGCVGKSPSGAIVSDVWVLDYDELAKLPKEELEEQGEKKPTENVQKLDADKVIAWLEDNTSDIEYYVKWFKKDFGLC